MTQVASFRMDGGLVNDRPPAMVPPNCWTAASNIRFSASDNAGSNMRSLGAARSTQPYSATWTTPAAAGPQFVLNVDSYGAASRTPTNYRWYGGVVYGGVNARIGQQTGGVDTNVTPGGWAAAPGRWTGGILNNFVPVLNNQTHPPVYWDYLLPGWQTLPGWPPSGAAADSLTALRPYREFLIGMGRLIPAGSYRSDVVYWSDASAYNTPPTTWVPSATNQAGEAVLAGGGEIVDGATLGEEFICYKQFGSYRMLYVGGNYIMAVRPMFRGWGAFSQNCIGEYAGKHYVFTGEDLVVTDGQRWESALYGKVRGFIAGLDATNAKNSWVWVDRNYRELWLGLVKSGNTYPLDAIVLDLDSGLAGIRTFAHPVASVVQESQESLGTTITSAVMVYPGTGTASTGRFYAETTGTGGFDGTNIVVSLSRETLDLGKPDAVKVIKWVRPLLTQTAAAVSVEVGTQQNTDDSITYGSAVTFTPSSADKADIVNASGRFLSFRFSSSGVAPWTIAGFDVGYELRGGY